MNVKQLTPAQQEALFKALREVRDTAAVNMLDREGVARVMDMTGHAKQAAQVRQMKGTYGTLLLEFGEWLTKHGEDDDNA